VLQCVRRILHFPLAKKFPEIHFKSSASVSKYLPNFQSFQSFHCILNAISTTYACYMFCKSNTPFFSYLRKTLVEETITNCLITWNSPSQSSFHFHGFIRPCRRLVSARLCDLWTTNFYDNLQNTLVGLTERTVLLYFHWYKFVTLCFLSFPPPSPEPCQKNTHNLCVLTERLCARCTDGRKNYKRIVW
jgi:hypothetical protein